MSSMATTYYSKPATVEAMQWKITTDPIFLRERAERIVAWVNAEGGDARYVPLGENTFAPNAGWSGYPRIAVRTIDGWRYAKPGHYIVRGEATFPLNCGGLGTRECRNFYQDSPESFEQRWGEERGTFSLKDDLLYDAWVLIANGAYWDPHSAGNAAMWNMARSRWRDAWHEAFPQHPDGDWPAPIDMDCRATHQHGWICTREKGHAGEHIATGHGSPSNVYARWGGEDHEAQRD